MFCFIFVFFCFQNNKYDNNKADHNSIDNKINDNNTRNILHIRYIEILFDPVPNLDEVAFGSDWNKKFRMEGKE
jgi:hypothetical protein